MNINNDNVPQQFIISNLVSNVWLLRNFHNHLDNKNSSFLNETVINFTSTIYFLIDIYKSEIFNLKTHLNIKSIKKYNFLKTAFSKQTCVLIYKNFNQQQFNFNLQIDRKSM